MEEDKKKENIIKEKKETLVVDEQKRVIDIETILSEKKDNTLVNAVNNLINCGSDYSKKSIIKDRFNEKAGNIVDETIALDILKEIFEETVREINMKDETLSVGKDGRIDKKETEKKLRNLGVKTSTSSYEERLQEQLNGKREIKDFFKSEEHIQKKYKEVGDFFERYRSNAKENAKINETKVRKEDIGENLFNIFEKVKNRVNEISEDKIELFMLQEELDKSKGTNKFDEINERFINFKDSHPELVKQYIDKNGEIKDEIKESAAKDLKRYKEDKAKIGIIANIAFVNQKGIENLNPDERKHIIMNLLAGLKFEDISKDVSKVFEQLVPGYKYSKDINNKDNRIAIEKALGYENMLQKEGFEALLETSFLRVLENTDLQKILANMDLTKISEDDIKKFFSMYSQEINVEQEVQSYKETREQKYFRNSKLDFTSKDEEWLKYVYENTTIKTWISSKEKALEYRYGCLLNSKEELEKNEPKTSLVEKRLRQINKEIEKFTKKYPNMNNSKIIDENGELKDLYKGKADAYTKFRVNSKLSSTFIEDADKIKTLDDYNNLSNEEKKIYLRNTIVALNAENTGREGTKTRESFKILGKFAKRRLEILNTQDNQFINIKNNQDVEINFDIILEEYNKLSKHNFKDYEELLNYCELNELEYVNRKLKLCEEIPEEGFVKLVRGKGIGNKAILEQIEKCKIATSLGNNSYARSISNALIGKIDDIEIDELELPEELKYRIKELHDFINDQDKEIMEFQRLQNLVETTSGINKKEAIKKRDELIRKNPNRKSDFLECVNNPIETQLKLDKYNESIVEKNALLTIGAINSLSEDDLQKLIGDSKLKKQILLTLTASLDGGLVIKSNELISTIQKICPDSKLIDENKELITDYEILPLVLGKELGIENCDFFTIGKIIKSAKVIMLQNENSKKIDNVEEKDMGKALDVDGLSMLSGMFAGYEETSEIIQSKEEKYFNGSQIQYTKDDTEEFQQLYYKVLSNSWIEDKETAESFRYIQLIHMKERADNNINFTENKKKMIAIRIENFEKKHPNLKKDDFIENGKMKEWAKDSLKKYIDAKYIGDLMSDYVIDEDKIENLEDYNNLSYVEKRNYMRKTMLGLLEENGDTPIISKLAKRRLEIISTPEKNFILKDEDNNIQIDKEVFFKEFDSLFNLSNSRKVNNFEELENLYVDRKENYARSRLKFYADKSEGFFKLVEGDDESRAKQIEKYKANNALKRALGIGSIQNERNKNQKTESSDTLDNRSTDNISEKKENREEDDSRRTNKAQSTETLSNNGIKIAEMKVEQYVEEKKAETIHSNEEPNEHQTNDDSSKPTLIDRIKMAVSNLGKSYNNDNTSKDENSEELALVEQKKGLFGTIVDKIKGIFNNDENEISENEVLKQESLEEKPKSEFEKSIEYKVDITEVTRRLEGKKEGNTNRVNQTECQVTEGEEYDGH